MLVLDNPSTWPKHIVEQLNNESVIQLCKSRTSIESIVEEPLLIDIFADVEAYAADQGLAGYHCTKQSQTSPFSAIGLRTLNFQEHHAWFCNLIYQHPDVDEALYQHIVAQLTNWRKTYTGRREKKIWFCLTRTLVLNSGTTSFFKYFGGEAVYFAFLSDERVAPILKKIGEPVVVEVEICLDNLTVFQQWAFGRTLVSHFAHAHNPKFCIDELEGYVSNDIAPSSVIAVHPHSQFVASLNIHGNF